MVVIVLVGIEILIFDAVENLPRGFARAELCVTTLHALVLPLQFLYLALQFVYRRGILASSSPLRSPTAATAFQAIHSSALLNTNAQLADLQLSAVLSIGSQIPLGNPTTCYEHALFYRNRRASGAGAKISTNKFWLSPKLETWSSSECSGLINTRGSFLSRDVLQDFCVDIIRQLRDASMPVLWALKGVQGKGVQGRHLEARLHAQPTRS